MRDSLGYILFDSTEYRQHIVAEPRSFAGDYKCQVVDLVAGGGLDGDGCCGRGWPAPDVVVPVGAAVWGQGRGSTVAGPF